MLSVWFESDWSPNRWDFISIKNTKEETQNTFSRVTDEHCGKYDMQEVQVWNYKIGLNNQISNKIQIKTVQWNFFPVEIPRGET